MFIKVVATGTGSFTGTQISPATIIVSDPNWIAGIGVLSGKFVRSTDAGGSTKYAWGPYPGSCVSPQCALGIDPSFPSYFSLVNPQTNPGVDFSAYPAQNACKAIGGRLPNMQELTAIHTDRASYGNNFRSFSYLSATEYGNVWNEWGYNFFDVGNSNGYSKNDPWYVRCVAG
jgi:hypothetical protein